MNGMGTLAISAMAMVVLVLICLCANLQGTGGTPDSLLSRANGDAIVPTSSIVDLLTAQQLSSKARKVQDRLNKAKKSAFAVADQILTDFPSQAGKRGPEVPDPHPGPNPSSRTAQHAASRSCPQNVLYSPCILSVKYSP